MISYDKISFVNKWSVYLYGRYTHTHIYILLLLLLFLFGGVLSFHPGT